MEPVVNGLEENYGEEVDFRRLNATDPAGRAAFDAYRLRGHPSYLILNPAGEVLWQAVGEVDGQIIDKQIQTALSPP